MLIMISDFTPRGRKFTFGNKPFKPHTPDRWAIANRLASLQETPPSSRVNFPSQIKQVTTRAAQEVEECDSTSTKPMFVFHQLQYTLNASAYGRNGHNSFGNICGARTSFYCNIRGKVLRGNEIVVC